MIGRDEEADVAILKMVSDLKFSTVNFADSDKVEQGDEVFTLGYPFGIKGDVSFKEGTISRRIEKYFETSAEIHPGNSGGPLVNRYGQVIGINSASYGSSAQGVQVGETIKLAIPVNIAKDIIPKLQSGLSVIKKSQTAKPVEIIQSCSAIIAETKSVTATFTNLYNYYKVAYQTLLDAGKSEFSGVEYFKQISRNFVENYRNIANSIDNLSNQVEISGIVLKHSNQDYLIAMKRGFADAAEALKGYYDSELKTANWIASNKYWDDYLMVKTQELLDEGNKLALKAIGYAKVASNAYLKIQDDHKNLLVRGKCLDVLTDKGELLIGYMDGNICTSLLGNLAHYDVQEYTCGCGFGSKMYGGRCELYTTICSLQCGYADEQGGCHTYPGMYLSGGTCVRK